MMVNFKKNVSALALALMVLLAGFFSVFRGNVTVSADGNTYPPYQGKKPDKVVYITDDETNNFKGMIKTCLEELGWEDVPFEVYYVTAESFILHCEAGGELFDIVNAAVILEFRHISLEEFYPLREKNGINLALESIIHSWKTNGCRVMFINSTEETLIREENRKYFSDLDIHINTDMFTLFSDTIVSKIETDGLARNCTILLNSSISDRKYENAFVQFLLHAICHTKANQGKIEALIGGEEDPANYILKNYDDLNGEDKENFINRLLKLLNIQILSYDEYNDEDYYLKLNELDYPGNHQVIAVGLSWEEINLISWAEFLEGQMKAWGKEFPVYYYSEQGLSEVERDAFEALPQNFACSGPENHLRNHLPEVLREFLWGSDLSQYDNWDGKCDVTHKTAKAGPGGWLNDHCRIHDPEIEAERLSE